MKRRYIGFLGIALLAVLAAGQGQTADDGTPLLAEDEAATQSVRFAWVDIYVDSGDVPLAAYQFELAAETGSFQIVGVEGGEHPAFAAPPYYDPAALAHDHVIIAAFSTDDDLPAGRTRVARIHVQIAGGETPDYVVKLIVAATADGTEIPAGATAIAGEGT
jgi:hypothetical protein